eukprot:comp25919_c0_seq1/m.47050 comp25919_c0_seq1/g.47050  ORF comp25919_c0_seq1/g.47050 comp25919_c0_seq1/m.47050 type:complete len:332 (-) comp25919_c0_seq1:603-1598(-)
MEAYTTEFFVNSGFGGTVHAARDLYTNQMVAVKTVRKTSENHAAVAREIACVQSLAHPNIITTFDVVETETHVHFIQEFAEGGDLFDHLQRFGCAADEDYVKNIFSQVVNALGYMHSQGFCHRDIKPENVVLSQQADGNMVAKLIDFGLAEQAEFVSGRVGTDAYAAPEVASITAGALVNGLAADVWSLGVILVALLCGRLPFAVASAFEDPDFAAFLERHAAGQPAAVFTASPDILGMTPALRSLLDGMLNPEPALRPTLAEVAEMKNIPWFESPLKENEDYNYSISSHCDSGCSWGDLAPEDEVDFASLPLPSFEPLTGTKSDSGVSYV